MKNKRRSRKQRRSTKAVLKFGSSAKSRHTSLSGRTGKVFSNKLKAIQNG